MLKPNFHRLPSRSQSLNPSENIFHLVKTKLEKEALERKGTRQFFEQFTERVVYSLQYIDTEIVDKTIESLPKRVVNSKALLGGLTKY